MIISLFNIEHKTIRVSEGSAYAWIDDFGHFLNNSLGSRVGLYASAYGSHFSICSLKQWKSLAVPLLSKTTSLGHP
jgi:hypothetical protein